MNYSDYYKKQLNLLARKQAQAVQLAQEIQNLRENLLPQVRENGIYTATNGATISYKAGYQSPRIDGKALERDGLKEKYTKMINISESLQVKL